MRDGVRFADRSKSSPKAIPFLSYSFFLIPYSPNKTPPSSAFRETADATFRLAVPEKRCRLSLIFAFFDRCGNSRFPFSATGGGNPQFPLGRGGYKEDPSVIRLP